MTANTIKLGGKKYRIDVESYRSPDIIDFSPRASVPGNAIVFSELGMYQPLVQNDWRHGFGFQCFTDEKGYLHTSGSVDTRHPYMTMLFTDKQVSETGYDRRGMLLHGEHVYSWGIDGMRRFIGGSWEPVVSILPQIDYVSGGSTTGNSLTVQHKITDKEVNRLLLVAVSIRTSATINYVRFNSIDLLLLEKKENTNIKTYLYYMINPPTGTYNISVSLSTSVDVIVQGISFTNINISSPFGTPNTTSGTGTSSSISVSSAVNDIVVDVIAKAGGSTDNLTAGSGQTEQKETNMTNISAAISTEGGASSVDMAWSWTNSREYAGVSVSIKPEVTSVPINTMMSLGDYLFCSPYNGRLRRSNAKTERVIEIRPTAAEGSDTTIRNGTYANTNFGTKPSVYVGASGTTRWKTLFKFNLSSIPAGAVITKVTLRLHTVKLTGTAVSVSLHRILFENSQWTTNGATWNKKDGTNDWAGSSGCSSVGVDYATASLYSGSLGATGVTKDISLDVTEFSNWWGANYGLVLHYTGTDTTGYYEIASSEHADIQKRPMLRIEYTTNNEWVLTGTNADAGDYHWMIVHNGFVYAGKRDTNRVHYSNVLTLSNLNGDETDTNKIVVGVGGKTLGAIVYASNLYVSKPDGLWTIGDDKVSRRVLDYSNEADDENFSSMTIFNGFLVFAVRDRIMQWNGARVADITPPALTDTFPYVTYGKFANLITIGKYMYCTARTNEETYKERLLCFDGIGWFSLADLITDGNGSCNLLFFDPKNNYLWINLLTNGENTLYYIPLQRYSEFPYPNFPTSGSHYLVTSRFDMGFRRIYKSTPSVLVSASNLKQNEQYIKVYYSVDGGSWVYWGTVENNGTTILTKPNNNNTIEYLYLQLMFEFYTTDSSKSPVLEDFTVRFILRPLTLFGWNFNVICASEMDIGGYIDERSAADYINELHTLRNSTAPIEFVDLHGVSHYGYITALRQQAIEVHVEEDYEGKNDVESIVNVNFVEMG